MCRQRNSVRNTNDIEAGSLLESITTGTAAQATQNGGDSSAANSTTGTMQMNGEIV